ncbi:DeoR/GlpR family DNA-binding transcription regulator [Bacillus taeanensis]|uniref:HTH deoR-type domain-containing protein n=1 Tax=Bacillus taeanensis TaxID=273032 RepID=A0A366XPL0_9BACI|nr:DeoR/GlpR family DNA-binding transcription regulator [Bacillus taeanensis]RBW68300.1 hypothetical protein DS031_17410 [Bacillus taeanensis]
MIPEKRQVAILELLKLKKMVSIEDIVKELNISGMTARRDLNHIEKSSNLIVRVRGGAKLVENSPEANSSYLNDRFQQQYCRHRAEKAAIGKKAASLIEDNETILIDAGSTTFHFARHLDGKNITAIVTAANIAEELEGREGISTILTGGIFRSRVTTLLNPLSANILTQFYADKVFMGVTGISASHGFMCHDFLEADVKKILLQSGKAVYWLADSSKLNKVSTIQIADWQPHYWLITDDGIDVEIKEELGSKCRLIIA